MVNFGNPFLAQEANRDGVFGKVRALGIYWLGLVILFHLSDHST